MASGRDKSAKDKQMAAYMKQQGIKRNVARCPLCHAVVGLGSLAHHIVVCRS